MTADPCAMPTGYGQTCQLPGDHDDGCQWPLPPRQRCVKGCLCLCHEGLGDVEHLGRPCYGKPGSTDVSDFDAPSLPPYSRKPITLPDGTPVVLWSGPATPTRPQRCHCGRPVPASSACGCHCAEHDQPPPRRIPEHLRVDDIQDYLRQKGEIQ